jgi:hypothetical protein
MPRTKKLNLGARLNPPDQKFKGRGRPKTVKDLVAHQVDNTEEADDDQITFESQIEVKDALAQDDVAKLIEARVRAELEEYDKKKAVVREEKRKAAEERKAAAELKKQEAAKLKEEARAKKREEDMNYINDIVSRTILQKDKGLLVDKIQHAKMVRASNLNF